MSETPPPPRRCPICGKPRQESYRPFCSKRCADVDLHRWFAGSYVVPGEEAHGAENDAGRRDRDNDEH